MSGEGLALHTHCLLPYYSSDTTCLGFNTSHYSLSVSHIEENYFVSQIFNQSLLRLSCTSKWYAMIRGQIMINRM